MNSHNGGAVETRKILYDEPIELSDATVVRAVVSLPDPIRRSPVLLMRTPYSPLGGLHEMDAFVRDSGFACVLVSVRGTGTSDGRFEPWRNDIRDGEDVVAWCRKQPWSSGEVVTIGESYLALTQLLLAASAPTDLKAMVLRVSPSNMYSVMYRHGAFRLADMLTWATGRALDQVTRGVLRGDSTLEDDRLELARLMSDPARLLSQLPLTEISLLNRHFPEFRQWVETPDPDDQYWLGRTVPTRPEIPALFVAGWHDIFLDATIAEFQRDRHAQSALIIGPWSHASRGATLGAVDYGPFSSEGSVGLPGRSIRFLQSHVDSLTDAEPSDIRPGIHVFVMGRNRWMDLPSWPPPAAITTSFYLASGVLADKPPVTSPATSVFEYDPSNPVPTVGGPNLMPQGDAAGYAGAWDQSALDDRRDILRFTSERLVFPLDVVGEPRLRLFAATTAEDTDWTAKLVDVHPDGLALNVCDGIVRASHAARGRRTSVRPGVVEEFEVILTPTAYTFAAGHKIRLDVSSSNFPRFDKNPGIDQRPGAWDGENPVVAGQTVYHDALRPSRVELPVLDPEEIDKMSKDSF